MGTPLSTYVLTCNSERHLAAILGPLRAVADEMIILDSGSTDRTREIADDFGCRFCVHPFENFRDQRNRALELCRHDMVFFLDSDEVPNSTLIRSIQTLKQTGFRHQAYRVRRDWYVLGRRVHCAFPVSSPDYPIRIVDKRVVSFTQESGMVHETPSGFASFSDLDGQITHHAFANGAEMAARLELYSEIAARQLLMRGTRKSRAKLAISPSVAWIKWYLRKGGWRDGRVGWELGKFAYDYTRLKYLKARRQSAKTGR